MDKPESRTIKVRVKDLIPYDRNPRTNDASVEAAMNSLERFGYVTRMVVAEDMTVVCGHTRLKAMHALGWDDEEIEVTQYMADADTVRAYRIVDNSVGSQSDWDWDLLSEEEEALPEFDFSDYGLDAVMAEAGGGRELVEDERYTTALNVPQYVPRGECPDIEDLTDMGRYEELLERIDEAEIPEDVRSFLKMAATRHIRYDYSAIAEFYAHAAPEVQELMEDSVLVIIDFDDAMAKGYVKLVGNLLDRVNANELGGDDDERGSRSHDPDPREGRERPHREDPEGGRIHRKDPARGGRSGP